MQSTHSLVPATLTDCHQRRLYFLSFLCLTLPPSPLFLPMKTASTPEHFDVPAGMLLCESMLTWRADELDDSEEVTGGDCLVSYGVGLVNCADVVADCFGLPTPAEAVAGGYIGATLRGDRFLVWFHWPKYE